MREKQMSMIIFGVIAALGLIGAMLAAFLTGTTSMALGIAFGSLALLAGAAAVVYYWLKDKPAKAKTKTAPKPTYFEKSSMQLSKAFELKEQQNRPQPPQAQE